MQLTRSCRITTVRALIVKHACASQSTSSKSSAVTQVWFAREYPCYAPNSLLLDNALATMGAGVPSALAAKLVKPEVTAAAALAVITRTYSIEVGIAMPW